MSIPYERIDKEIRPLVRALNESGIVRTFGSCEGHGDDKTAAIIFNPIDDWKWGKIKLQILNLSNNLPDLNINIYQWHRLGGIDWVMEFEAHSTNRENLEFQRKRVREDLNRGFQLVEELFS